LGPAFLFSLPGVTFAVLSQTGGCGDLPVKETRSVLPDHISEWATMVARKREKVKRL